MTILILKRKWVRMRMYGEGLGKDRVGWVGYQWQLFAKSQPQHKSRFVSDLTDRVILINSLQGDLQLKNIGLSVVLAVLNCKNNFIEIAKFLKIIQDYTC